MTGLVTFGDLLDLSRRHLDRAVAIGSPRVGDRDLPDIGAGMFRLAKALEGCLGDAGGWLTAQPGSGALGSSPWPGAIGRAREAAAQAAWQLSPVSTASTARRSVSGGSERGLLVREAATTLAAGRDLLFTHVRTAPNGERVYDSDWAPDIASPQACRALAAEVAELARRAAAVGASLVTGPARGRDGSAETREAMASACRSLRALDAVTAAANQHEPVIAEDRELLRAVPLNITPRRQVPRDAEPAGDMCEGITVAASRLRSSVRQAARRAPWMPEANADTLRHAASASMAAQHNCGLILHILASHPALAGHAADSARLEAAAAAADRSRDAWLTVARGLKLIISDTRGYLSPEVAGASDLAMWTGRLAYADPDWNLSSGPHHQARTAIQLAASQGDVGEVIAAIHHASDALSQLAQVHQQHARTAARQGRLLVSARTLPDRNELSRPYEAAPPDRTSLILSVYRDAQENSSEARTAVAEAAREAKTPSRILAAIGAARPGGTEAAAIQTLALAGPAERSLRELGTTDVHLIARAVVIDQAFKQLLADAATGSRSRKPSTGKTTHRPEVTGKPADLQLEVTPAAGLHLEREAGE
jgi:hypothetical protein